MIRMGCCAGHGFGSLTSGFRRVNSAARGVVPGSGEHFTGLITDLSSTSTLTTSSPDDAFSRGGLCVSSGNVVRLAADLNELIGPYVLTHVAAYPIPKIPIHRTLPTVEGDHAAVGTIVGS